MRGNWKYSNIFALPKNRRRRRRRQWHDWEDFWWANVIMWSSLLLAKDAHCSSQMSMIRVVVEIFICSNPQCCPNQRRDWSTWINGAEKSTNRFRLIFECSDSFLFHCSLGCCSKVYILIISVLFKCIIGWKVSMIFLPNPTRLLTFQFFFFLLLLLFWPLYHSFETSPARQIDPEFRAGTGLSFKKIRKFKIQDDPVKPDKKLYYNLLIFFTKTRAIW